MPEQQQDHIPGRTKLMDPTPDHGEASYKGSGKLTGKAAVITGGDSGIGRAVAIAFAREGADVLIAYLNEDDDAEETARWVREAGRKAVIVRGDIWPTMATVVTLSARPWRRSAGSTCWSTTPPFRRRTNRSTRSPTRSGTARSTSTSAPCSV